MILVFLKNLQNQKNQSKRKTKELSLGNSIILLNGRRKILNVFESGIFSKRKQGTRLTSISDSATKVSNCKVSDRNQLKILTIKQTIQRLPIALA